jgi:hypothetical protein
MAKSCPQCNADVVYTAHPGTILLGHCDACGESLTLLSGSPAIIDPNAPVVEATPHGRKHGGKTAPEAAPSIECPSCDGPLSVRWNPDNNLETTCPSCNLTVTYMAEGSPGFRPPMVEAPRARQWRGGDRTASDRGAPPAERTARPCRQCGAPLRFSTSPDGTVQGECTACGNRFSMAPRPDGPRGGGGRGGPRSFGGPPRRGGFGGGRGFSRGGPPGARRFSPRGPPRRDDDNDDDDGGDRRRRRPRRE